MLYEFPTYEPWSGKHLSVQVLFSTAGLAQSVVIESEKQSLLVDVGDGCLRDLLIHGIHPVDLSGVVITHGHFDHVGGLHSLLSFLRMIMRVECLPVIYPEGAVEVITMLDSFERCYAGTVPFLIERRPLKHGQSSTIGNFNISALEMIHCGSLAEGTVLDPIPALGYRIEAGGETVAVTGDTGLCDNLRDLVRGVDLAVIEATFSEEHEIAADMLKRVHLSVRIAEELAATAKASRLVHRIARRKSGLA
ncbi:MAG TPA: MBL fold metallo-hydrolase [candidate division Zixibacteria bacterium]|nr:MBL fold metallo-hydrolase [candidate division Zixibacteria bacterium]